MTIENPTFASPFIQLGGKSQQLGDVMGKKSRIDQSELEK